MSDDTTDTTTLVPPAPGPDDVKSSATCSECDQVFTQAHGEKSSANFKLAAHRYNVHGLRSDGKKGQQKNEPTADDFGRSPIVASVRSIGSAAGSSKRPPSEDDLARAFGRGLGLSTMAVATYAVEGDPNIPEGPEGDRQRDALVDYLSLSDKAARDLMHPIARALAPTSLNTRYGRGLVDNVDVIGSLFELGALAQHWRKYMRMRAAGNAIAAGVAAEYAPPASELGAVIAAGNVAAAAPEEERLPSQTSPAPPPFQRDLASPAPQRGVILTPAMVEAMRRQKGQAG